MVSVCGGEYELFGLESLAAIDGSEHFGMQAGGNGEEFGGDEREAASAAIIEVEGAGVETGPVTAGDTPGKAVTAHGNAGWRGDLGGGRAGSKAGGFGSGRMQAIGGNGDPVGGTAGE